MTLLVTGSRGYIGSHLVPRLRKLSFDVVEFDKEMDKEMDLRNTPLLTQLMQNEKVQLVIHLAAQSIISHSVKNPAETYETNVIGSFSLLTAMQKACVKKFIFASSASASDPQSPYAHSKAFLESALLFYHEAYQLSSISLRYFNPVGGVEKHNPETHLFPLLLQQDSIRVHGTDYQTRDGTCIRDYIHIEDVVEAHVNAIRKLQTSPPLCAVFDIGTGVGTTVLELVESVEKRKGKKILVTFEARRPGDIASLIANRKSAKDELAWSPRRKSIADVCEAVPLKCSSCHQSPQPISESPS